MTEYLDILNEDGLPTGETRPRKEVHKLGLWHRAILVIILDKNNKILIQQRSANKEKYPNKWDLSVAGHVPAGIDSLNAAYIEIMEEIGIQIPIDIKLSDFKYITSFRDRRKVSDDFIENQYYDLYALKLNISLSEVNIQLEEVQSVDYKNPYEIKEMQKNGLFHPRDAWINIMYKSLTKVF